MTPFDKKIEAATAVQNEMDKRIIDEVVANNDKAIKIQADQMFEGKRGDGQDITPSYTPFTVRIKRQKRQPSDRVTLRDTGDFQDAIVIDYGPDSFKYDSVDEKRVKLARKYGENIFGLNDEGLIKLIALLKEGIIEGAKKAIINA